MDLKAAIKKKHNIVRIIGIISYLIVIVVAFIFDLELYALFAGILAVFAFRIVSTLWIAKSKK